jgi:hypothetical protein
MRLSRILMWIKEPLACIGHSFVKQYHVLSNKNTFYFTKNTFCQAFFSWVLPRESCLFFGCTTVAFNNPSFNQVLEWHEIK